MKTEKINFKLDNIVASGAFIGGEHTLQNEKYIFTMLSSGAFIGTNSYLYKLTKIN